MNTELPAEWQIRCENGQLVTDNPEVSFEIIDGCIQITGPTPKEQSLCNGTTSN